LSIIAFRSFNFSHTDNTLERRDLSKTKKEYTTQKIRQEWEQDQLFLAENDNEWQNSTLKLKEVEEDDKHFRPIASESLADDVTIKGDSPEPTVMVDEKVDNKDKFAQEDSKSKKKRRKKSFIKKKNSQRKGSTSSSSNGSAVSEVIEPETESTSLVTGKFELIIRKEYVMCFCSNRVVQRNLSPQ
jgi:phosphatidate phosphatase LPIN